MQGSDDRAIDRIMAALAGFDDGVSARSLAESIGIKHSTTRFFIGELKKQGKVYICKYEPMPHGSYMPLYRAGQQPDVRMPKAHKNRIRSIERRLEERSNIPNLPDALLFLMGYTRIRVRTKHAYLVTAP